MGRSDLTEATMHGWARLNPAAPSRGDAAAELSFWNPFPMDRVSQPDRTLTSLRLQC